MKNLLLISIFISITINSFSQPFKNEQEFKDYLIANIRTIDPIEGIWAGKALNSSKIILQDGTIMNMGGGGNYDIRIAIIKVNDKYIAYHSSSYSISQPLGCFNYIFDKTATTGKYLFDFTCAGDVFKGQAYMNDNNSLYFAYKNQDYKSITEGTVNLTKLSLNEDDIKNALTKNPPTPNKVGGTAFAIGDRYIVTACHVVKGYNNYKVRGIGGDFNRSYNCILNSIDSINDMAVLYISDINFQGITNIPYTTKTSGCKVGEKAFCLGYPLTRTMGEEIKLTDGLISSKSGFLGDTLEYQISVPVQPGNSGGPLFDNNGNLVGIIIAKHTEAENASYALKISCLKKLIKKRPTISTMPVTSQLINKDLPAKVSLIQNYVYILEAEK